MRYGLPEYAIESLVKLLSENTRIHQTILFGSRAKGTHKEGSDIDLCLMGERIDTAVLADLEGKIDDLLLPWKVDLIPGNMIDNEELLDHIHRVGKTLYERITVQ